MHPPPADTHKGAAGGGEPAGNGHRVLVIADEAIEGSSLVGQVTNEATARAGGERTEVRVVAPALATSGLKHQLGDIDEGIESARRRLEISLGELRRAGLEVSGEVGDSDPVVAIDDELGRFPADEILVVTHTDQQAAYAEKGLLQRAREEFEPPIIELVVERTDDLKLVSGADAAPAGAERPQEHRFSPNLPPISARDGVGMAVAILGTLALIGLAVTCQDASITGEELSLAQFSGGCAIRYLIAGGVFLINLAHVVGILIFESVRYRGLFERFFARLSLYGTPLAIVVSLLVA